jgi:hypothetical protein
MSFIVANIALIGAGWCVLRLLGLLSGSRSIDGAIAWFTGVAWFSAAASVTRFLVGVPYVRLTAVVLVVAPAAVVAITALFSSGAFAGRARRPRKESSATSRTAAVDTATTDASWAGGPAAIPRWIPRPLSVYAPLAGYVIVVLVAVALHGINTPTVFDDGLRVRAYAPELAFVDAWNAEARQVAVYAGPVPTFGPTLAWKITGTVDPFHVNYFVLCGVAALLLLAVSLSSTRGRPEWGWGSAFAVMSLPLYVYHATSTHGDAALATWLAAGFLYMLEYGRTHDARDAARAFLLFFAAAMVKREGELVAGVAVALLLIQVGLTHRRGYAAVSRHLGVVFSSYLVVVLARVRMIGFAAGFPFYGLIAGRVAAHETVAGAPLVAAADAAARPTTGDALAAFLYALLSSGNAGLIWWVFPATVLGVAVTIRRRGLTWALLVVVLLLAQAAASAVLIFPEYTVDQTTVHRSLISASVVASLWVAAVFAWPDPSRT